MTVQTMLPSTTPPPPLKSGRFPRLNTLLGRFQLLALATTLLATIALFICFIILSATTANFRELVTKITPSIEAAQKLGQSLEELDARAADYQLTSRIDITSPDLNPAVYGANGLRASAWNNLEESRRQVDNALALVRSNASYPGEADAINRISQRFYDYNARISLMRYELDLGRKEAALASYKAAQDILVGNLGNPPRDAAGNSPEKLLKDNNWGTVKFICASNCPSGTAGTTQNMVFDSGATYEGIAANIFKLTEINQQQLDRLGGVPAINSTVALVTAGLVAMMALVISLYYALITHRVINIGFALAVIGGFILAGLLVANLNAATSDYDRFSGQYIQGIRTTSSLKQLSAGAQADISRLLLSPDSPGLDSTRPDLTVDVKQAFSRNTLLASYENKRKQAELELTRLWQLADTSGEIVELCKVTNSQDKKCPGNGFNWEQFNTETGNVIKKFDQKLLADAILINLAPVASPTQNSARAPYNAFSTAIGNLAEINKSAFDLKACGAIGVSEFGNQCNEMGYLNQLQIIVWIAFPLLSLLVAGGVWFASREF